MNARGTLLQLQDAYERRGAELSVLNKIGMQLSAERDIDKLLDLILQKSREITGADAGSLYLVQRAADNGKRTASPSTARYGPSTPDHGTASTGIR